MLTSEEAQELVGKLDLTDLAFRLSQMALKVISGKTLEMKEYDVKVSLPVDLVEPFLQLSILTGVDTTQILGVMASEGITWSIKNELNRNQVPPPAKMEELEDIAKTVGFDMTKMKEGMSKMQQLAADIDKLQKVLNVNDSKNTTNTEQSPIPLREKPCPKPPK